ncbi:cysteine-rich receptor-like protein kinase 26 [Populus alba]|uniref:cysteine-rich receptor-like protein kinase 26 n=1 Tax=Populus alba TaxID=43335 RepID=UPI0015890135|nr:cysteine-rich receptor-like protein kinase 26 [Populus alba]
MDSLRLIVLFSFSCILLASLSIAQPDFLYQSCRNTENNYTANSTFQKNLDSLLSSLASNTQIDYGYYNFSAGQIGPDQVHAIALCRGDILLNECRGCVSNSVRKILQVCPNQKEAIGIYDFCILRYSNRSSFGVLDEEFIVYTWNTENASHVNLFSQALGNLTSRLRTAAASGTSLLKFATGNQTAGIITIFGLVQCMPDLSAQDCDDCLAGTFQQIRSCCDGQIEGKIGGRIVRGSCYLRFETYPFYRVTAATLAQLPLPPSPEAPPAAENGNTTRKVVIIIVSVLIFMAVVVITSIFLYCTRPKQEVKNFKENGGHECVQFRFSSIRVATHNFSDDNKLGQGGFGAVYKGLLQDGQAIAVKRLARNSAQGEVEFTNEVLLVARLQHRNLVRLLGFCFEGTEKLLVYEFLPNSSLDQFLFDPSKRSLIDWEIRYLIIVGIARGVLYLHQDSQLRVIHRDLKASNILLDDQMNAKISDFGMAKLFQMDQTQDATSRIVGTLGYMAPEYAMHGCFSAKSDVFSFGVLVLEIITGRQNGSFNSEEEQEYLLTNAWESWNEGRTLNLIDPILKRVVSRRDVLIRCFHIGLLCVQEKVADRPTMASVILMLSSDSFVLPLPSRPPYCMHSAMEEQETSRPAQDIPSSREQPISTSSWSLTNHESYPSDQSGIGHLESSINEISNP